MSSQQSSLAAQRDGARKVFRSPGAVALWWIWVAVAVLCLADLAVQGRGHSSAVAAVVVAAISGIVYGCALRPRIVADSGGITLVNPLRDHRVPWGAVDSVDTAGAVRVHCVAVPGKARGKILYSWAVQSSPRSALRREMADRRAMRRFSPRTGRQAAYGSSPEHQPATPDLASAESVARLLAQWAAQARQDGAVEGRPVARWAWLPAAAMFVPMALVALVALL